MKKYEPGVKSERALVDCSDSIFEATCARPAVLQWKSASRCRPLGTYSRLQSIGNAERRKGQSLNSGPVLELLSRFWAASRLVTGSVLLWNFPVLSTWYQLGNHEIVQFVAPFAHG